MDTPQESYEPTQEELQAVGLQQRLQEARREFVVARESRRDADFGSIEWCVFMQLQIQLSYEILCIREALERILINPEAAGSQRYQLQFTEDDPDD